MTNAGRTSKQEWLDRIERGRAAWEELVAQAGEAAMDEPGAMGDWSFKDVAAHLNGWRELTVARLEAAVADERLDLVHDDLRDAVHVNGTEHVGCLRGVRGLRGHGSRLPVVTEGETARAPTLGVP